MANRTPIPFLAPHHLPLLPFRIGHGFFVFPHHDAIRASPSFAKSFGALTYAPDRKISI